MEGDQLIKQGLDDGWVSFGDSSWTDYDLCFEAQKTAGPPGIGCGYRIEGASRAYLLNIGDPDGRHVISHWNGVTPSRNVPSRDPRYG